MAAADPLNPSSPPVRILGVVASSRKLGNTELLVSQAAQIAARFRPNAVAEIRLLRLTDLTLAYCNGCMRCGSPDVGPCPLEDDMEFLLTELDGADALVFGTPAYTLLPPGPVKLIADRLIMAIGRRTSSTEGQQDASARQERLPSKPAITIGVAGLPRWSEMLLPLLNGLVMGLGFRLVGSVLEYAAGPGEVLLSSTSMDNVSAAGALLGRALAGEAVKPAFDAGRCPVCGADFFRLKGTEIECPVCLAQGRLVDGVAHFDPSPSHRWERAALEHHFHDWIQGTMPAYLEHRSAIRRLQKPFRDACLTWVRPPHDGS